MVDVERHSSEFEETDILNVCVSTSRANRKKRESQKWRARTSSREWNPPAYSLGFLSCPIVRAKSWK